MLTRRPIPDTFREKVRTYMKRFITLMVSATALAMTTAAQTAPAPVLLQVSRVQVKPDRATEYREIEGKYTEAYKKGGGTLRAVYQGSAGNPYEYMVVTALPNFAAMDGDSVYVKGSTAAAIAALGARRSQCTTSVNVTYERPTDIGLTDNAAMTSAKVFGVNRYQVRPGMADEFMALMKNEIVPALKKGGVKDFKLRRVEYGGSRELFTSRRAIANFAELDGGSPMEKALGKDGAAALTKKSRALATTQYFLYRMRTEISLLTP